MAASTVLGHFFRLYVILDLYSRKIVAAEVWDTENAAHSCTILQRAYLSESILPMHPLLVLHGDNGSPLKAGSVLALMHVLGITPSHSRPRVSNDNPHAESLFRTLKYHPSLPAAGFASLEEARAWTHRFVQWYNHEHLHSSLRFVTPAQKHAGEDAAILARRAEVYRAARERHPERWNGRRTRNWSPVRSTTLNPVSQRSLEPIAKRVARSSRMINWTTTLTSIGRGAILVDDRDMRDQPRVLFYLEHTIQDAGNTCFGEYRVVSRQMLYVEIDSTGNARHLHYAPYPDYRPLKDDEPHAGTLLARPECAWISSGLEDTARSHAIATVVPQHLAEVKERRLELIAKTRAAVKDRLTKEINCWDHRAEDLKLQEHAGKPNARLNSNDSIKRAELLQGRLEKRMDELALKPQLSPLQPVVLGGMLIIPQGLLNKLTGKTDGPNFSRSPETQVAAARARQIIMDIERSLGFEPVDRELEKLGYDIESRVPGTGRLRFIEVKGRISGAATITVTRNEILYSLNKPDNFVLAIVEFISESEHHVHYLRCPFLREPDFGVTSVKYAFSELMARASSPQ